MLPSNTFNEEVAARIKAIDRRVRRLETLEQAGCFNLISSQTGATFAQVDIPTIYKNLYVVYSMAALLPPVGDSIGLRFNGDAGNNYNWIKRLVTGAAEITTTDGGAPAGGVSFALIGQEGPAENNHSAGFAVIPDYLSTSKWKSWVAECHEIRFSPTSLRVFKMGGRWINTAAISTIDIPGTYFSNSTISIYGLC